MGWLPPRLIRLAAIGAVVALAAPAVATEPTSTTPPTQPPVTQPPAAGSPNGEPEAAKPPAADGVPGHAGEVIITEIMTNPSAVLDSRGEWFEVHNPGPQAVDLTGWVVTDERSDRHVIGALSVPAGGYATFARLGNPDRNGGVVADHVYGDDLVLLNNPDRLVLLRPDGTEADRVDWGRPGFPWPRGRSMSLRVLSANNAAGGVWCLSTTTMWGGDLGSPGAPNQCEESKLDLVVSEVLQNPRATGDSVGEWFEILNRGPRPIDLIGFTIKDDDRDRFTIDAPLEVPPGGRVVLGRTTDRRANGNVPVDHAYGDAMDLHNSRDELVVLDPDGVQVDRVAWDDGRTFPDPNGASMVLDDPSGDNDAGAAWCEATVWWSGADRGTPGAPAGCTPPGPLPPIVITEILFDPNVVGDRAGEWFELANLGDVDVALDGWVVSDDHDDRHVIGSLTVPAGGRVVLAERGDDANGGVGVDHVYGDDLVLHNTVDELVLETPDGLVVDRVKWGTARGFPDPAGASIELRDPTADNAIGGHWCEATQPFGAGDFGTPGAAGPCAPPGPSAPLVITEVMRNPAAVPDDDGEWFEIHNPTTDVVDLLGWRILDKGSDFHRVARSVPVPAGGYVLVGRSDDESANGGAPVAYAYGTAIRLSNTADELILADPLGQAIDRIEWDGGAEWLRPNGASMSLRADTIDVAISGPQDTGNEPTGWCESAITFGAGDRGTPGHPTICLPARTPDRVVINEVHRDPSAVVDSVGEWVELHNLGDESVDLGGWVLRDDDWDDWTIPAGTTLGAGGFLVVGKSTDPGRNGGVAVDVAYGSAVILFNAFDELTLVDDRGAVVDRVRWRLDDGFPGRDGASAQRRDPEADGTDPTSWCTGVAPHGDGDLGTPGQPTICDRPDPEPLAADVDPGLSPILECVAELPGGLLEARFGYENQEEFDFSIPVGADNRLVGPVVTGAGPVTDFVRPFVVEGRPGRTPFGEGAFRVSFHPADRIVWALHGRTATASDGSTRCGD